MFVRKSLMPQQSSRKCSHAEAGYTHSRDISGKVKPRVKESWGYWKAVGNWSVSGLTEGQTFYLPDSHPEMNTMLIRRL